MGYFYNALLANKLQKKAPVQPSDISGLQQQIDTLNSNKVSKFFTSIEELEIGEIGEYQGETNETFTRGDFYERGEGVSEFRYTKSGEVTLLKKHFNVDLYQTITSGICPSHEFANPNHYISFQNNSAIPNVTVQFTILPLSSNVFSDFYVENDPKFGTSIGYLLPYAYAFDDGLLPLRYENQVLSVYYNETWYQVDSFSAWGVALDTDNVYYAYIYQDSKLCPAWFYCPANSSVVYYGLRNDNSYFALTDSFFVAPYYVTKYLGYWDSVSIPSDLYLPEYVNIPAVNHVGFAKIEQGAKADTALQSIAKGTDGSYITTNVGAKDANNSQTVSSTLKMQAMSSADNDHKGVAETSDVKQYITENTASQEQGEAADTALQEIEHGSDGSFITLNVTPKTANKQTIYGSVTIKDIATASSASNGLATALDVRNWINVNAATTPAYGVMWDTADPSPTCIRIGNMTNHVLLPVHSQMVSGVLQDDGTFTPFDNQSNWTQATQLRDGTDGQVMVRIPQHWQLSTYIGTWQLRLVSPIFIPGYIEVPMHYCSAYEATLQRSTNKLCSVNNADADYRGGDYNSVWDGTYRTLLNRPVTNISLTNFRTYARNRAAGTSWNQYVEFCWRALYWLFVTEYATLNSQTDYNSALTPEGFRQGGLGPGVTTWDGNSWYEWNLYSPFVPCGYLDEYGSGTAVKDYSIYDANNTLLHTFSATKYRGIENPFGHIWKWVDGVLLDVPSDGNSVVYATSDPSKFSSTSVVDYNEICNANRADSYIKTIAFGEDGYLFCTAGGGNSAAYYCDQYWVGNIPSSGSQLRALQVGSSAVNCARAGLASAGSVYVPGTVTRDIGARLCFIP